MRNGKAQYAEALCPKCGRVEEVTKGATLVMCWRCAMAAADRAAARELQASQEYDWRQIILTLKQNHKMRKESTVAWALGISPGTLSKVKKGRRSMPDSALKILKEKYSECIKMRIV